MPFTRSMDSSHVSISRNDTSEQAKVGLSQCMVELSSQSHCPNSCCNRLVVLACPVRMCSSPNQIAALLGSHVHHLRTVMLTECLIGAPAHVTIFLGFNALIPTTTTSREFQQLIQSLPCMRSPSLVFVHFLSSACSTFTSAHAKREWICDRIIHFCIPV